MLKNESSRNSTKPTPLRPDRLPDSGGIIFSSNRVRMEKISHSVRQAKHAKFLDADCTCPYRLYRTRGTSVQVTRGSTRRRHMVASGSDTCQADLALLGYDWTNPEVTSVTTERVTRGTG
jgi:hypothetical protein